jgi:membrane-associated phospholipid phosphatase
MRQRERRAVTAAGIGLVLLLVVNFAAFHLGRVERLDASVFNGFGGLRNRPHVSWLATLVANLCDPVPYVYLCVMPLAIALLRRRRDLALLAALILLGANATTHWLKPLLDQRRLASLVEGPAPLHGAWPSGHATAAMSLALCLVLVVAPRWRARTAALGTAFALAVSYAFLTLGWHYPTDAVGGFLIAFTWTCLGVAAHSRWRARPAVAEHTGVATPARSGGSANASLRHELAPIAGGVVVAAALAVAMTLARPQAVVPYAHGHERFIAGVGAIGTLAVALATSLVVVLRRARP